MSLSLPDAPNLEQLRKQAKDLVKARRSGDTAACDTLRRLGRFKGASDSKKLFFVSWWCFDCLENARHAAARFLNDRVKELQGTARSALAQAAGIYGQMAWKATEECFDEHSVFLGPWSGKSIDDWTEAVRTREQEVLTEMEQADSQARTAIDRALAAIT